jgi:lipopolysaccharide export system permease protein
MTRIQRLIVFDTLQVLLLTLVGTTLIMTLGGGVKEALRKDLPLGLVASMFPFFLPEILRLTIPASMLFAICTVYSRLSASEELTAVKSLGINPWRVITPVIVLAYLLSLLTFGLYEACAIWSRPHLQRVAVQNIHRVVLKAVQAHGVFKASQITVMAQGVRDGRLVKPTIEIANGVGQLPTSLLAEEASLEPVAETGRIRLRLYRVEAVVPGKVNASLGDEIVQEFAIEPEQDRSWHKRSPAEIPLRMIADQIQYERHRLGQLRQEAQRAVEPPIRRVDFHTGHASSADRVVRAAHRTIEKWDDRYSDQVSLALNTVGVELPRDGWNAATVEAEIREHTKRLYRLQAEPQRRLSNGFATVAFCLIGIPVAIRRRSTDNMSVFFTCFVPVALIYYPLLVAGEEAARGGWFPSLAVWLAPLVLVLWGALLLKNQLQH